MTDIIIAVVLFLGAVGGGLVGLFAGKVSGRREGRRDAENRAIRDTVKRAQDGRDAVAAGRDVDPADSVLRNDERWK